MAGLLATVFMASLLGSLHCAGMCGPFAWLASGDESGPRSQRWRSLAGYHGARLVLYVTLGGLAGTLGWMVDWGSAPAGIQRGAAWLSGLSMIAYALFRWLGMRRKAAGGNWIGRIVTPLAQWLSSARSLKGWKRAALIGIVSSLMPCGWLYAFMLAAAGTGHPATGAALMAVFWGGTVPILAMTVLGIRLISTPIAVRIPGLLCVAVIALGIHTLVTRTGVSVFAQEASILLRNPAQFVREIDQSDLRCCEGMEWGE